MRNVKFETWLEYIKLLVFRLKMDIDLVFQDHPELRKNYDVFMDIWRGELLEAAKKLQTGLP